MDNDIYELGREQYRRAIGYDTMDRDDKGFVILRPTASRVDERKALLTTNIDDLEERLKKFRAEKAAVTQYQKTDEYKASKKKSRGKKHKKARENLLSMVFNNADAVAAQDLEDEDENEEGYHDIKKKSSKKKDTTLDTTYGKRFSPVVSMLHDTIADFDKIASEIEDELQSTRGQTRNMYRSTQIGNLISAKNSKLSAVKELGSIAKTVSDLEYKKEKDKKSTEGSDTTRAISNLGAKYLRGVFDIDDDRDSKKGKKNKNKDKKKGDSSFKKNATRMGYDSDDDDYEDSVKKPKEQGKNRADSDDALARAFADEIMGRKNEFSFSPHERHLSMEGKYTLAVVCSATDPENTWKYIAVNPKTGEEIEGFRKEYKDLIPSKKKARMRFDLAKKQCTDLNTSKRYKLMFNN